jgi:tRNA(Ile)-lysidine synthase
MAARRLRHEFLARAAVRLKTSKIALAHHADDQIELFFLRLLRGSGMEGLAGMKWRSPSPSNPAIELVRPLFDQPKEALREFATKENIPFREDASNASVEFQRNRIRHELLPLLRKHYQPALDKTILRVMEIVRAEGEFVGNAAAEWLEGREIRDPKAEDRKKSEGRNPNAKADVGSQPHPILLIEGQTRSTSSAPAPFSDLPVAVQRRCVQMQLLGLGIAADFSLVEHLRMNADKPVSVGISSWVENGTKPGAPTKELQAIRPPRPGPVLQGRSGKPGNAQDAGPCHSCPDPQAVARDARGILHLVPSCEPGFNPASHELDLDRRAGDVLFAGATIRWQILPGGSRPAIRRRGCEFFDADRVGGHIVLRHWQPGDRFHPIGMAMPVKLQDLFTNLKISRAQRHKLILAATASGEVFWVEGLRISERFKLTQQSNRRLRWQWA